MGTRKRSRSEANVAPEKQTAEEPGLLQQIRSNWEFASLMQYIAMFGKVMKIDEEFEIEDLEEECLKPEPSYKLLDIGLCMLKWISSHRGLTTETFDEYTRRQFNAKAPNHPNPFGHDEEPLKFIHFDVFTKLHVLHQLSVWTFWNADRIREKLPEKKETEQIQWRIEEFGWDKEGRSYYVLDDNRLYRRTDPPIPAALQRPKKKPKGRASRGSRASRRVSGIAADEASDTEKNEISEDAPKEIQWECIAVTLDQYRKFTESIRKSKDADEKLLRERIEEHVMPLLEKAEEAQQRKLQKREKELLNMQLLAGAKRSSRLAQKEERDRAEKEAADLARKREQDLAEARREQAKQAKLEDDRQSRMMTREQRIKDREQKRILHEAELARIAEEQEKAERGEGRVSARNLKAEREKSQKTLEDLSQDDEWIFDCAGCGTYGENVDDGSHSVACEKCNVWQHSKCLGIKQADAEKEDFHFVCKDCKRKEEEAKRPKIPSLKFRVSESPQSTPTAQKRKPEEDIAGSPAKKTQTLPSMATIPPLQQPSPQPTLPPMLPMHSNGQFHVPPSPERRPPSNHNALPSSSPPRPLFSPPKHNNLSQSPHLANNMPTPQLPPMAGYPGGRPSSSHSGHGIIQSQPAMSPTQGNRDVGPIAGFPPPPSTNGARPWSSSFESYTTPRPQSGQGAPPSTHSNYPPFSASATPNGNHSSPPQSSHGIGLSGISPTKQSPRPITSGGMAGAPVLPPIRRLDPSPKLMGRSSPDAPIPPPVKCMTPEQEERRARENANTFSQGLGYQPPQNPHLMSSPSVNRIPSLGPAAVQQQQQPFSSPQRGGGSSQQ